ncbi:alpha/beta fold hydrolase [Erwinia sp.]|uniref:alpha/beta fold hydrolase n=1 Tax=Erwinia citreus TaxID=558 RepID=UPI003C7159B5
MQTSRESEVLRDNIHGAALEVIEDSGHMLPLEQPKALAAVITRWLAAHPV